MSLLEKLLRTVSPFLTVALVSAVVLVVVAYHGRTLSRLLQRCFAIVHRMWREVQASLARWAAAVLRGAGTVGHQTTLGGRLSVVGLAIAVAVLLPLLLVSTAAELRMVAAYFESIFTEVVIEFPGGALTGGLLRALLLLAGAFLVGYLAEGLLGLVPLPLTKLDGPRLQKGARVAGVAVVLCLWLGLATTVADVANEVYDGLGRPVCIERLTDAPADTLSPSPDDGFSSPSVETAPDASPAQASTVAGASGGEATGALAVCTRTWQANARARWMQVATAELALHLNLLFGWVLLAALGLTLTATLGALGLGLHGAAWLVGLLRFLPALLFFLLDHLLDVVRETGYWIIRFARWLGVPLPLPEHDGLGGDVGLPTGERRRRLVTAAADRTPRDRSGGASPEPVLRLGRRIVEPRRELPT